MENQGMMAIVRGLPDAGLVVTVVDAGKQYTLLPQAEPDTSLTQPRDDCNNAISRHSQYSSSDVSVRAARCVIGAQAIEEQYASNYKIEYCHVNPTSPPVELTEFPPQRSQLRPDRVNFKVDEIGSGGYATTGSYRSGSVLIGPGGGSNSISKVSTSSDAFANSLRKYPNLLPERSLGVPERLISVTKATNPSKNNGSRLNKSITTCYQVHNTDRTRSPQKNCKAPYKSSRTNRESPTRDAGLSQEFFIDNRNSKFRKNVDVHLPEDVSRRTNEVKAEIKIENVSKTLSNFKHNEIMSTNNQEVMFNENTTFSTENQNSYDIQNVPSIQARKKLTGVKVTERKKNCCHCLYLRKKTSAIQSLIRCKEFKHRLRHYNSGVNKIKRKRLKKEVLNLIRQLNTKTEQKFEDKIKIVLFKVFDIILEPNKTKPLKDEFNKIEKTDFEHYRNHLDNFEYLHNIIPAEFLRYLKNIIKVVWKKYTKGKLMSFEKILSQIQRILTEETLHILKYHTFKEYEKRVLAFMMSTIITDFVNIFNKRRSNNLGKPYVFEYSDNFDKVKELFGHKKKFVNSHKNSYNINKYQQNSKMLRKLIQMESLYILDNKKIWFKRSKEPLDLKLRNLYKILKKIHSSSTFNSKYVTNMLLNQYCKRKCEDVKKGCHQTMRTNIILQKCLSDTYLSLHDSSRNKAILTRRKIDKNNLHSGTKLLTSFKNKWIIESSIQQTREKRKHFLEDYNQLNNNDNQINGNNISSFPYLLKSTNNLINQTENMETEHVFFLHQIKEKVKGWLSKLGVDQFQLNKKYYDNISDCLANDIADQLKLLTWNKSIGTVKPESIADYFKYIICRHLFIAVGDENFEVLQKVSELIQEILNMSVLNTTNNNDLNVFYRKLQIPRKYKEKRKNIANYANAIPASCLFQASNGLIEDIYTRIVFRDQSVHQDIPGRVLKEKSEKENGTTGTTTAGMTTAGGFFQKQMSYVEPSKYRSGVINVAMASMNKNDADEVSPNNSDHNNTDMRHLPKPNRTESDSTILRFNNVAQPSIPSSDNVNEFPERMTRHQLHEYYVEVFRKYCQELPIIATTPDLIELAREGVLHNILKLFFMLLEDPNVENDYTYFEFRFEDEIDGLLDLLPQIPEMKKIREGWKIKLVMEALKFLKYLHKITDDTEFSKKINYASNRRKLIQNDIRESEETQQLNALRTAQEYLMLSNYQVQNSLQLKIYMQRLINRVNEIYDSIKRREGKLFLSLPIEEINDMVFNDLGNVPIPNNDITKDEIDLVHMNDEIEKWYNELPVVPTAGLNFVKRKILTNTLAKKIHDIEKHMDLNEPSFERDIKHEISRFLSSRQAGLENDQDLNINFMVEELSNRLRRIRYEKISHYESFSEHVPLSSTIVQQDIMTNENANEENIQPYISRNINIPKHIEEFPNEILDQPQNDRDTTSNISSTNKQKSVKLKPVRRSSVKGILGTSQMPGPSTREARLSTSFCGPRLSNCTTRNSPHTVSLFTPDISNHTTTPDNPEQFYQLSELDHISPTENNLIHSDRRANIQDSRLDQFQNQRSDDHSVRESATRHINEPNNFVHFARQEEAQHSVGQPRHSYGTKSTAQVGSNIPHYRFENDVPTEEGYREQKRIKCRCGDTVLRRRRRYACCCQDYFAMPHCCLIPFPYGYFF